MERGGSAGRRVHCDDTSIDRNRASLKRSSRRLKVSPPAPKLSAPHGRTPTEEAPSPGIMIDPKEVKRHIAGHGFWKARLRAALADGAKSLNAADVRPDDRCAFGKWLRSQPATIQGTPHWKTAMEHHRSFHLAAADVVELIQQGEEEKARQAIALRGSLSRGTSVLVRTMVAWMEDRR